jgi:hypothetical protein
VPALEFVSGEMVAVVEVDVKAVGWEGWGLALVLVLVFGGVEENVEVVDVVGYRARNSSRVPKNVNAIVKTARINHSVHPFSP